MDANPRVCVETRLFPGRVHATNKARTCQDCKGPSLMSDRHNQQGKSATAFHLLTNTLTARLVQISKYKSLCLSHHSNSEGGKRQGGEDTRRGSEELGWSVRTQHHSETDSWPEPLQLCWARISGCCSSGQAWEEHTPQPGLRCVLPHCRDTLQLSSPSQGILSAAALSPSSQSPRTLTTEGKQQMLLRAKLVVALASRVSCPKLKVCFLPLQHIQDCNTAITHAQGGGEHTRQIKQPYSKGHHRSLLPYWQGKSYGSKKLRTWAYETR